MRQDFAAQAALCLDRANYAATPARRAEYLELADRYERLAAIEQGLIPEGYTRGDTGQGRS